MNKLLIDVCAMAKAIPQAGLADRLGGVGPGGEPVNLEALLFVAHPDVVNHRQWLRTHFPQATPAYFHNESIDSDALSCELLTNFIRDRQIDMVITAPHTDESRRRMLAQAASEAGAALVQSPEQLEDEWHKVRVTQSDPCGQTPETLAIVSPYPPMKTGIADYTAGLLPYLSDYYDIVLVVPDDFPDKVSVCIRGMVVSETEFLAKKAWHQQVLYQLGNSPFHLGAFRLLEKIPGVVVMHDICFGDVRHFEQESLGVNNAYTDALLGSHGSQALISLGQGEDCHARYPCSLSLLQSATAVIVHSNFAKAQIARFFGAEVQRRLQVVPLYKTLATQPGAATRIQFRAELQISPNAFVVATFGYCTPMKWLERLLSAWRLSHFNHESEALLLIVGQFLDADYEERIRQLCSASGIRQIRFVGYTDAPTYQKYLQVADLAVQLRAASRGETSAAVMDCMAGGVPVVANRIGSVSDMPDNTLWKISTEADIAELLTAIEFLADHPELRIALGESARDWTTANCAPDIVAAQYKAVIDRARHESSVPHEKALMETLAQQSSGEVQRLAVTRAIVKNRIPLTQKQLLVDVTAVVQRDLKTGIQRVVRSMLAEFYRRPPEGYRIEPVYLDQALQYRYAFNFIAQPYGLAGKIGDDPLVQVTAGDIYFGVDMHTSSTVRAQNVYQSWRASGVRIVNVLYDLLPVQHPEWFPAEVHPDFSAWLETLLSVSDGILAISRTVAESLQAWMRDHPESFSNPVPVQVGWFHLGADIAASMPTRGLPEDAAHVLAEIAATPSFLMVSTVEPRKGHRQALAAFECLWRRGVHANLVIVGKHGWLVDQLVHQIRTHPEYGQRLFWLESISDEYLDQIYPRCTALLAASEGEGFGLPIIEAAQHKIPIIARDIPVFREVGGSGVSYFQDDSPEALADYLTGWLQVTDKPDPAHVQHITWAQSAQQALDFLLAGNCPHPMKQTT